MYMSDHLMHLLLDEQKHVFHGGGADSEWNQCTRCYFELGNFEWFGGNMLFGSDIFFV